VHYLVAGTMAVANYNCNALWFVSLSCGSVQMVAS